MSQEEETLEQLNKYLDLLLQKIDQLAQKTESQNVDANILTPTSEQLAVKEQQPQVISQVQQESQPPAQPQQVVLQEQEQPQPEQPVDRTQIEVEEQPIVQPQIAETVLEQPESVVEQLQQPTLDVSPDEWTQVVQPPTPNESEITGVMPQQGGNPILELSDDEDEFQ